MLNRAVISNLHCKGVVAVRFLCYTYCAYSYKRHVNQQMHSIKCNKIHVLFVISTTLLQVSAPSCHPQETNRTKEQKSKTLIRVSGLRFWICCLYHALYLMIFILLNFVSTFVVRYSEYNY